MSEKTTGTRYDLNVDAPDICLTQDDLLVSLGIAKTTLFSWIKKKHLPPPYEKCGGKNMWTIGQIRRWRAARAEALTSVAQDKMVQECKQINSKDNFDLLGEFQL